MEALGVLDWDAREYYASKLFRVVQWSNGLWKVDSCRIPFCTVQSSVNDAQFHASIYSICHLATITLSIENPSTRSNSDEWTATPEMAKNEIRRNKEANDKKTKTVIDHSEQNPCRSFVTIHRLGIDKRELVSEKKPTKKNLAWLNGWKAHMPLDEWIQTHICTFSKSIQCYRIPIKR